MSILNQYVGIAQESTYGTAITDATKFRGYEARSDGFERAVSFIEGGGRRKGKTTMLASRRRKVDRGATGSIESAILSEGELERFGSLIGIKQAPTTPASNVYTTTLSADATGPDKSYTVLVGRAQTGTGQPIDQFTYAGCVPTGFEISVEENGFLMATINYDVREETDDGSVSVNASPVYPGTSAIRPQMYIFEDCAITIGGTQIDVIKSFSLSGDLALDTNRFFIKNSALKDMPIRSGVPSFTGSMSAEFNDDTLYDLFAAGGTSEIVFTATGPEDISSSINTRPSFQITMHACQFEGSSPQSSLDGVSMIELPFKCLENNAGNTLDFRFIHGLAPYLENTPSSVELDSPKAKK